MKCLDGRILLSFNVNAAPDSSAKLASKLISEFPEIEIAESFYHKNGELTFGENAHVLWLQDMILFGNKLERSLN